MSGSPPTDSPPPDPLRSPPTLALDLLPQSKLEEAYAWAQVCPLVELNRMLVETAAVPGSVAGEGGAGVGGDGRTRSGQEGKSEL